MKMRNLFALLMMIGLAVAPVGAADDGEQEPPKEESSANGGNQTSQGPSPPEPIWESLYHEAAGAAQGLNDICVQPTICLPEIVCVPTSGSGDSPVEFAPRGIGIVVATHPHVYTDWYTTWENYIGGAVLC
jgi:hypothetical protein